MGRGRDTLTSRMKLPAAAPARPKRVRSSRRPRQSKPLPFNALIAYADVPAARRAMNEIRDVLAASGRHYEFRPMLWRFDQLGRENWSEVALRDAAEAAIVVVASTEVGLDLGLERWVGQLLARKLGKPMTIVAVLGATEAWTISIEQPVAVPLPTARQTKSASSLRPVVATTSAVCAA